MRSPNTTLRLIPFCLAAIICLSWAQQTWAGPLIDVNTASAAELETLPGIGPSRAEAIVAHREANGPFASVDALTSVRGIGPGILSRIRDLVTVGSAGTSSAPESPSPTAQPVQRRPMPADGDFDLDLTKDGPGSRPTARPSPPERSGPVGAPAPVSRPAPAGAAPAPSGLININTADEDSLTRLRGVGPARARAIIAYRTTSGPFRATEQIREVSGIGQATYNNFRDMITVRLDLNTADLEELEAIGLDLDSAERLIAWRETSGPFRSVDQLTEVPGFGRGALETLRPFIWVEPR